MECRKVSHHGAFADGSLQRHCKASQGPIFVSMHLWMHTILVSNFTGHADNRRLAI